MTARGWGAVLQRRAGRDDRFPHGLKPQCLSLNGTAKAVPLPILHDRKFVVFECKAAAQKNLEDVKKGEGKKNPRASSYAPQRNQSPRSLEKI